MCSASWIHYWTDFDDFGLQMTVKEWSMILPRKNWGFQNASLQKCLLRFKGGADYLLGIHLQIMKRWADYLEQDGFVYIICLLAANDMFGLCVSKKGEGGGGAELANIQRVLKLCVILHRVIELKMSSDSETFSFDTRCKISHSFSTSFNICVIVH